MKLTTRQLHAVEACFIAGSSKGAARQPSISWHTVTKHLADVNERLGVATTDEAIHVLVARGEIFPTQLGR